MKLADAKPTQAALSGLYEQKIVHYVFDCAKVLLTFVRLVSENYFSTDRTICQADSQISLKIVETSSVNIKWYLCL